MSLLLGIDSLCSVPNAILVVTLQICFVSLITRHSNDVLAGRRGMTMFDAAYCRAQALAQVRLASRAPSVAEAEAHHNLANNYQRRANSLVRIYGKNGVAG